MSPAKPCRKTACPNVTRDATGHCDDHKGDVIAQRAQRMRRGSTTSRGYGHRWSKVREIKLGMSPLCEIGAVCDIAIAVLVDHIQPIEDGGAKYELANLQSSCRACHDVKTRDDLEARANA